VSSKGGRRLAIRVVIDYRPALFGRGGIAVYTRELADAYATAFPSDDLTLWGRRLRQAGRRDATAPAGTRLMDGRLPSRVQDVLGRFGFGVDRMAGGADVVHWTDYVPLAGRGPPVVATVHDVLFEELPDCYTPGMRRGLRRVTRHAVRRASRVIVPSSRSRDALVVHFGADPGRIDVIPHGVRPLPDAPPAEEYGPYLLFVGTLEPRKNLRRLLEAHARLAGAGVGVNLVVAGPRGWMDDAVVSGIRAGRGVSWEDDVTPARLASLYRGALALAYPSLGEGFGLPVLEAMSEGLAVVVAADTTCADLAGEAALAVDPRDVDAIAKALDLVVSDAGLRGRLGAAGRARAARYAWAKAAEATRRTYEMAVRT
jgi:glycosyltransferase involved in cell wall biosynthesis